MRLMEFSLWLMLRSWSRQEVVSLGRRRSCGAREGNQGSLSPQSGMSVNVNLTEHYFEIDAVHKSLFKVRYSIHGAS